MHWAFGKTTPTNAVDLNINAGDILYSEDLLEITNAMEFAYNEHGAQSIVVQLRGFAQPVRYHFSKLRLIINVNNNIYGVHCASNLLDRLRRHNLLKPHLVQTFSLNRINEPLAGFLV
ncbi:hypothetical protein C8R43DRAFT_1138032 [Mycena crocata]|nr:hypothetical protein C8R43DRAFT_1138032 [Mycena crocata]